MPITDLHIDTAYSDLKKTCGGVRNDYFGLLYLEKEHDVPRAKAVNQVAFGGNDYGLDGFHFDPAKRNLYLFQFKYSDSPAQFKGTLQRLIDVGMERIFLTPNQDDAKNQLLLQLRSCLIENRQVIDQIFFRFATDDDLRKLTMPVLVLGAADDISFPGDAVVGRVKAVVPHADGEVIAGCKHCPPTTPEFQAWLAGRLTAFFGG